MIVENLANVGATDSFAAPLALDDAMQTGKIQPGNRLMLLSIERSI
jgi:3-oxoacyl-[acyl-carrier-protein] synthase III